MTTPLSLSFKADLVVISYLVSVQAAYTALNILQMRSSRWLLAIAAMCLSVSGIWAMHFVGMAAMKMHTDVSFGIGWTIASVVFAYVPTFIAFLIIDSSQDDERDTRDISLAAHIAALKEAPHKHIAASAALIALGVCAMHYTGMLAMTATDTHAEIDWGVLAASVLIAIFAAVAALYFAFVLPITREYTVPTALVAGVAVCGMHYCGMFGMRYVPNDAAQVFEAVDGSSSIEPYALHIVFAASALSSASLALSSFLYRQNLLTAADEAQGFAGLVIEGRFEEMRQQSESDATGGAQRRIDPIMRRMKDSYSAMGMQMDRLRSFLPPSLLAQFEATRSGDDDEGDLSLSRSQGAPEKDELAASKLSVDSLHKGTPKTGGTRMDVGGMERRNVAVLSFNLIGLHDLSDQDVVAQLTTVSQVMSRLSKQHRGVVDVLHGDRVLMTFNTSMRCGSPQQAAALAAVGIADAVGRCCAIGVASGQALVGNVGTCGLVRFTVHGRVVTHAVELMRRCQAHHAEGVHAVTLYHEDLETAVKLRALELMRLRTTTMAVVCDMQARRGGSSDEWMYELASTTGGAGHKPLNEAFVAAAGGELERARRLVESITTANDALSAPEPNEAAEGGCVYRRATTDAMLGTLSLERLKTILR
jgi:NO-binding membrane sensor protein with MHYT domain/class 3 adenylate cyclase